MVAKVNNCPAKGCQGKCPIELLGMKNLRNIHFK